MTDIQAPTPKRRRWRFQFSLRTLMIAVIVYGMLWIVTIKWGVNQLALEEALERAPDFHKYWQIQKPENGQITLFGKTGEYNRSEPMRLKITAYSPAPFLIVRKTDLANDDSQRNLNADLLLWIFGYKMILLNDR